MLILSQLVLSESTSADEAAGIAAMFQASQEVWAETQEKMAQFVFLPNFCTFSNTFLACRATPVYTNRGGFRGGKPFNQGTRGPDGGRPQQDSRPVPPGYICYRCAKKGLLRHMQIVPFLNFALKVTGFMIAQQMMTEIGTTVPASSAPLVSRAVSSRLLNRRPMAPSDKV